MHRPNKLHDELDALLDGRPVELTDDLAPLLEAADVLRAELAAFELDPEVADRHLERVLEGSATVVRMPVRQQPNGWDLRLRMPVRLQPNGWDLRRRVAAVVLAAALVLAPATMASAAALPGQAMYPFKLAIEQLRLASVQWSTTREAGERTRVADERLDELERLVELKMFSQLPTAIDALSRAVMAADAAVDEAAEQGEPVSGLAGRLDVVKGQGDVAVRRAESSAMTQQFPVVSEGTRDAIHAAVDDSQDVLAQPTVVSPTPTTTPEPPPATAPPATEPPPATAPPPTEPPATAPSSTADSGETPGSVDSQAAPDGWTLDEVSPASVAGP
ncbi:MAG TPA: hypothetical protein VGS14_12970 [Actinomycetes bacterium]|nr:hypothetical protein [Actinomycetes bacterium]